MVVLCVSHDSGGRENSTYTVWYERSKKNTTNARMRTNWLGGGARHDWTHSSISVLEVTQRETNVVFKYLSVGDFESVSEENVPFQYYIKL